MDVSEAAVMYARPCVEEGGGPGWQSFATTSLLSSSHISERFQIQKSESLVTPRNCQNWKSSLNPQHIRVTSNSVFSKWIK